MKEAIAKHLNITEDQILAYSETSEAVIVVIDYGIAGGKKFEVSKADLQPKPVAAKKTTSKRSSKKKAE